MKPQIAVIGCGHWGRNFVRVLKNSSKVDLVAAVDEDLTKVHRALAGSNGVATLTYDAFLKSPNGVTGVVVATPARTHYELVSTALDRGWDVLVEKPFTTDVAQAEELTARAAASSAIVMLGHTFLYNPAVRKSKEIFDAGAIGDPYYIHARRTHLGLIRDDVNAVWDLAPHDISIINYLLGEVPTSVSAVGGAFLKPGREDVAFITLHYPNGVIGNLFVSWADSHKVREVQLVGSRGRLVFNDLDSLERVKVFEKGVAANVDPNGYGEHQLSLRDGNIYSPSIPVKEPLQEQVDHFVQCMSERSVPLSDVRSGADVVRVLAAVDQSMKEGGAPVPV